MHTKLTLWTDEAMILSAIADQELTANELYQDVPNLVEDLDALKIVLSRMVKGGIVVKSWKFEGSIIPVTLYAIAPELLSLNCSPYSYASWRDLSE
jgi:hypothetical protein